MKLSELSKDEIRWALAIRDAARADPTTAATAHEMKDLEFVQHAIIAKDNVDKALVRIKNLQKFKDLYGIMGDGSYEDGLRDVESSMRFFPDFFLGFSMLEKDGSHVFCYDFSQYKVRRIDSHEGHAVCMRAFFYYLQAAHTNVDTMRAGVRILGDFQGLSFDNFSVSAEKRAAQLYNSRCYPMRLTEMTMMRANVLIRLFYAFLRKFILTKKAAQAFQFTPDREEYLQVQNASLFLPHNLPKSWGGKQTGEMAGELLAAKLRERYENAATFRLTPE
mmetsp:Transcript_25950/g.49216  ORF Transcript_25950/g.49216 Transcript_25950/m.49216 type:complete len:277 (-) Transcript_25950:210-1040(-)